MVFQQDNQHVGVQVNVGNEKHIADLERELGEARRILSRQFETLCECIRWQDEHDFPMTKEIVREHVAASDAASDWLYPDTAKQGEAQRDGNG